MAALNHLPGTVNAALDAESATAAEDHDVQTDEPTVLQVIGAIRSSRMRKLNDLMGYSTGTT